MKVILYTIMLTLFSGMPLGASADGSADDDLMFEGTVMRIGNKPSYISGDTPAYQLVRYRVERIYTGRYEGSEIVVDHLILNGKELAGVKLGDRVCVTVRKSDKILLRENSKGIRKASDIVKVFYIGGNVTLTKSTPCTNEK